MKRLLLLMMAGCGPALPAGSYLCGSDGACPSGQHCACGLCVNHDDEAACTLDVSTGSTDELTIHEHEAFPVTVKVSTKSGGAAGAFGGTVALSFRLPDGTLWGDVRPSSVQLKGGQAQVMVTVNRETIPPQEPRLEAHFAGASGHSAPLHVLPQPFVRDSTPVAQAPFGWADLGVGFPSVAWDGKQFRMYFAGLGGKMQQGFGLATSSDNKTFTPNGVPLFPGSDASFTSFVLSAFPFKVGDAWRTAVYGVDSKAIAGGAFWVAESSDGVGPFALAGPSAPALQTSSCAYCDQAVWFPSVLARADSSDWLMFFGALHCNKPAGMTCGGVNDGVSALLGRAHSTDGLTFQPEPAPILSGDMGGETYLAAPQVIKDGAIYKMWYAFARDVAFGNPCLGQINVGYATSTDGFYWVRSPSNPVLALDNTGWEGGATAMLPGSVVPVDGVDPESGLVLYYSPLQTVLFPPFCIPNGIGRAAN